MNRQDALNLIYETITKGEWGVKQVENAPLLGRNSVLDSLGVVSFVIDVETSLRVAGKPVILANDKAMSRQNSPFRTVSTLADYIVELTNG